MNNLEVWQANHREAIEQQLRWLHEQPQGIIFVKPSGVHFVMVDKAQSKIRLTLLRQDNFTSDLVQSELDLTNPLNFCSPYRQAMMLALLWQHTPNRIYIAGLGGGRIPLVLHHYFPEAIIECTDLDPTLIEVATRFFGLQLDEQMRVVIQDGRQYLQEQSLDILYDIIISDVALGSGYLPYRLATQEFYELCKAHLSAEGVVVVNLLQNDPFYLQKLKTIQAVFAQVYLCPLALGNTIAIATNSSFSKQSELIAQAQILQDQYQFAFSLIEKAMKLKMGWQTLSATPNWEQLPILKDELPPVGYFDKLPAFNTVFAKVDPRKSVG
ncbi:MAG: spermine synthase, partial [Symploca sp. SIO2E6]|nr:spermine synthase [Symploca sp. SIO2E6]